jgi:hypothetical protein
VKILLKYYFYQSAFLEYFEKWIAAHQSKLAPFMAIKTSHLTRSKLKWAFPFWEKYDQIWAAS